MYVTASIVLSWFEQFTTVAASLGLKTTRDQLQTEFEEVRARGIRTAYQSPVRASRIVNLVLRVLGCPPTLSFACLRMIECAIDTHNCHQTNNVGLYCQYRQHA